LGYPEPAAVPGLELRHRRSLETLRRRDDAVVRAISALSESRSAGDAIHEIAVVAGRGDRRRGGVEPPGGRAKMDLEER
jgi:hypothetical protein